MFLYENEICPVCQKGFEQGDDIVTCPECGTPHHRECYNACSGCKNRALHGTGFVYKKGEMALKRRTPILPEEQREESEQAEYYVPESDGAGEGKEEFADTAATAANAYEADNANDKIDGVSADDVASVVSVNTLKFMPKFRKNRLINWNWSAFVFGPFYFFFRKMHVHGAVFTALQYGVQFAVSAAFLSSSIAFETAMAEVKTMADYYEAFAGFMSNPEYQNFMAANTLILVSLLVIHVVCALFADSFYRKKVLGIVKAVDEKVDMGESFSIMGPLAAMESGISQKDMRKMFLSRQGGVSTLAPLLAMIIIQLLLNMLNAI